MNTNYQQIIEDHLEGLYAKPMEGLEGALPARKEDNSYCFRVFGENCCLGQEGFIVCVNVICMAYGLTVFFCEREENYPDILPILLYLSLL